MCQLLIEMGAGVSEQLINVGALSTGAYYVSWLVQKGRKS